LLMLFAALLLLLQVIRQQQIHQRLQAILGDMVARERGGEIVDKALLRSITQVCDATGVGGGWGVDPGSGGGGVGARGRVCGHGAAATQPSGGTSGLMWAGGGGDGGGGG
jgi:hypothetical protein